MKRQRRLIFTTLAIALSVGCTILLAESPLIVERAVSSSSSCVAHAADFARHHANAAGWLHVDDTPIDYPIMRHPTDDTYYLSHTSEGDSSIYGAIFMQHANAASMQDPVTALYGHAMLDNAMFGSLSHFAEQSYFDTHRTISICTPNHEYRYHIIAAFRWGDAYLFDEFDLSGPTQRQQYIEHLAARAHQQGGWVRQTTYHANSDKILVLSTCDQSDSNQRFLVHAVEVTS